MGDLGFFHSSGSSSGNNDILVQDDTLNQLRVFNGPTNLLHDTNVAKINVGRGRRDQTRDRRDSDWCQSRRILRDNLERSEG